MNIRTDEHLLFTISHKWCQTRINTCNQPLILLIHLLVSLNEKQNVGSFNRILGHRTFNEFAISPYAFRTMMWIFDKLWVPPCLPFSTGQRLFHILNPYQMQDHYFQQKNHFDIFHVSYIFCRCHAKIVISYSIACKKWTQTLYASKAKPPEMQLMQMANFQILFHSHEMHRRKRFLRNVNVVHWLPWNRAMPHIVS